jgi:RNA recognition motif-containing protein
VSGSGSLVEETDALSEGRRIYLGNILYHVRPEQITEALQGQGFGEDEVDQIHISVDPVTGRNPGYCFVEFETKEYAETALERMAGVPILGRPLKAGPCKPKAWVSKDKQARQHRPIFERWGNWNSDGSKGVMLSGQGPMGAEEHLIEVVQKEQRYRVFVGGLGKMINQAENDKEMRSIFEGFRV